MTCWTTGPQQPVLQRIKKVLWYEYISRRNSVSKVLLQSTVDCEICQVMHIHVLLGNKKDWTQICVDDVLGSGPNDEEWWLNQMFVQHTDRLTVSHPNDRLAVSVKRLLTIFTPPVQEVVDGIDCRLRCHQGTPWPGVQILY